MGLGTVTKGIKAPIIRKGDDLIDIIIKTLRECIDNGEVVLRERDIFAVTEAVVAKAQGNIASFKQVASDVKSKFDCDTVGVVYPIFSRNRFAYVLNAIAKGIKNIVVLLPFPQDEVGNSLLELDEFESKNINPLKTFSEKQFRAIFSNIGHPVTGVDYIKEFRRQGKNIKVVLSNKAETILKYTDNIIVAEIHRRQKTKNRLLSLGAKKVLCLDEFLNTSIDGSGYNAEYGLLGSNINDENSIKLFPHSCDKFCDDLQKKIMAEFGVTIECMVYGDGAFRDSCHQIWELADPVICPGFTKGLIGSNHEIKIKYLSETKLSSLDKEQALNEMKRLVREKAADTTAFDSQGTTPRRLTDLLGSLADLTSGSGDKGTPFVLIQNYFGNIATEF